MSSYEIEQYRQRIRDLESQLQRMDVRFSNILTHTGKGVDSDYELHLDLEKVTKQMMQKRNEAELWKQKYEQQLSLTMQIRNNYELELQQLSKEVQRLLDKIDQFEYEKRRQDNQQPRAIEKDLEIEDLVNKLQRMRQEHENESQRLLNDNESLRHKINQIELDRQKELEQMRFKIETFHSQNLDNLRKTHSSQLSVVESEIDKLRGLLEIKNSEIETLLQQNLKMKVTYENQISEITNQYDAQKQKAQKQELVYREQLLQLQNQFDDSKLNMNKNYELQMLTLEKELKNQQQKSEVQCKEILNVETEKQQILQMQIDQLRKDNEILKQRQSTQEQTKNQDLQQMEQYTKKLFSEFSEQESHYQQQIQNLQNDLKTLQDRESLKSKDVESQIQQFILIKQALEEDLQHLRLQNQNLVEQISELEKLYEKEWKLKLSQNEAALKERIKSLEQKNDQLMQKQKEMIDTQIKQIPEKEFKQLIDEIENLKTKSMVQEREKLKDREDLRIKLEQSNRFQIDNLKTAFNTQIKILDQENQDLKNIIGQKENTIQELLLKYQNLERAYSGQAIGPQEQASKNIYQAYIRSTNRQSSLRKQ